MENLSQIAPILGAYTSSDLDEYSGADLADDEKNEAEDAGCKRSSIERLNVGSFGDKACVRYEMAIAESRLQWTVQQKNNALVLSPTSRLDESTVDAFKRCLNSALDTRPRTAVLDLSGVEYMSSRGLRGLILAQRVAKASGITIVLARPNKTMREILAISRYDQVFLIAETLEDAIGN